MAPLIDIVFLTLVFFMTTSVFSTLESDLDITLPTAAEAEYSERERSEIFVNVRADGAIVLNNRTLSDQELTEVLRRVAEYAPGGSVIIRGDKNSPHGRIMAVLNSCKAADIPNVSFAALEEE